VIYTFGTPEQKARFLPRIVAGQDWWCQGYSEPGAGSDLAALQTRAERVGDHYVVNGQKTWTTLAQHADWGFFLVRTDPQARKQAGISFLLIDMRSPGVTVRPIITLDGAHEVNEVWLEDVRVPVENRVHVENKGWTWTHALPTPDLLAPPGRRTALMLGDRLLLMTRERLALQRSATPAQSPWIVIPDAGHHCMVDQPLALVAALRAPIVAWQPDATYQGDLIG